MDKTKIAVQLFDRYAQNYQDKYMDLVLYDDTFDQFCELVKNKNANILELACGPGNITRYLLKKRPDFKILGTDLSPNMLALAKKNNPQAEFELMDCRLVTLLNKTYDALVAGFCLPYLDKEEALLFIKDASSILNPGGILYISTMEDDYSKSGLKSSSSGEQMYMHYHQADYLSLALEKNGFKIINLQRKDFTETDGNITKDLVIIAKK